MNSLLLSDAYKQSHREQYPEGTTLVYSNWTPRSDKHAKTKDGVVVWGIQAFVNKMHKEFEDNFFDQSLDYVLHEYESICAPYFGTTPNTEHIEKLHRLQHLPIIIKALPEGTICPIGVPMLTIYNTLPEFFWVTNFLETYMSCELWQPMTSATISFEYKMILNYWADVTCDNKDHVSYQAHDFSMRGMSGLDSAISSGAAHLTSFIGSDTIPAVGYLQKNYKANGVIARSIPATEHSVMSMGTNESELNTFRRLITETYPNGLLSIVSDTWDLWKVTDEYLPLLKEQIMIRNGKVVIRPDSGNPADIICGTRKTKGVIERLWDTFGGEKNTKGFKVLDSHIGCIYGDSITLDIAQDICLRLKEKGFASSNIVFGVGSFTYQYNTRDTYGFAMKATYGEVNHIGREIYKDPITDDGTKKSLRGLLCVTKNDGKYIVKDRCTWEEEDKGCLEPVYLNGEILRTYTLETIRRRLNDLSN